VGAVPAAYLLYSLFRLLRRIETGQVFTADNVELLRRISWSCFAGAIIALISLFYYYPWVFVAVAAAFMGLIVRVVKNVVAQAVELQNEADYTV
jgi:Flp pilus assembly protein TadB